MSNTYGQTATQTYSQSPQTYSQSHAQTAAHGHEYGHPLYVLDDRDILTDLLMCEKQLLSAYGTATIESTNPQLRQTLSQISKTEADFHTKTFQMMHQRGWYETPRSEAQLAGQIASLWTQKMQRHSGSNQHSPQQGQHPNQQSQQYTGQTQSQRWPEHQGDGQTWQQGWGGPGADQWNQPWNRQQAQETQWPQTGQAAARTWDPAGASSAGPIPGAHT